MKTPFEALNLILNESYQGFHSGCLCCGTVNEIASHAIKLPLGWRLEGPIENVLVDDYELGGHCATVGFRLYGEDNYERFLEGNTKEEVWPRVVTILSNYGY